MKSSRVLFIAYSFPPLGGSGVYRTAKFVKYLPQFGWHPLVVCGDDGSPLGIGYDATLLTEVPSDAQVFRMPFVSPYGLRRRLQRMLRISPGQTHQNPAPSGEDAQGISAGRSSSIREVLGRLGRVLNPIESPPIDMVFYWALSIVPLCRRLIEAEKVNIIYTSADPYSDHVAGWVLKQITGKPWVADFRDSWTQTWDYRNRGWRRRLDLFAEQRVLHSADRIIGVTASQTQGLRDLAPKRNPLDFVTLENGFDEQDFAPPDRDPNVQPGIGGEDVLFTHVGTAYEGTVLPFLQVLARLGQAAKSFRVRFVGGLAPQERSWLREHALDAEVEILARVSHGEAVYHMQISDALLLLLGEGPCWKTAHRAKVFEYMAAGQPIILAGPEGDASRLLESSGTGVRLPLESPDEATAMLGLLASDPAGFRAKYYHPDLEVIARYERRALTGRLAALFDELISPEPAK